MIGMVMRQENPFDMPDAKAELREPDHGAAAAIDQLSLIHI